MESRLEQIYNTYQRITGMLSGKPFRYRRNFEDFDKKEPEKYASLVKVAKILNDLPGVNPEKYFEAPYKMFPSEFKETIIGLDFYCKPRAIRTYTNYITSQMTVDENLMTEEARSRVLQGLKHIIEACRNTNYMFYMTAQNSTPAFINDLNHGLINKWVLAGFSLCGHDFNGCVDFDMFPEAEFMFGNRDINGTLNNMLSQLSEREIKWLHAVTQRAKNNFLDQKTLD